jgi:hypothetical protein
MITNRLIKKINELASISTESIDLLLSLTHQVELTKGQRLLIFSL